MRQKSHYTYRYLARFIVEAKTPLSVGSGQKDVITDSLVALDVNGLPFIPGTSLAGVVRSILDPAKESSLFGYQRLDGKRRNPDGEKEPMGLGSKVVFTEGKILDSRGSVVDGLQKAADLDQDPLLAEYRKLLPIRQHVAITERGTAKDGAKFDQQVVYAGSRFCFEVEIVSADDNQSDLNEIINAVRHRTFRLGGGTRKGYGEMEVVDIRTASLNLQEQADLEKYLAKSADLSTTWPYWSAIHDIQANDDPHFDHYQLTITPRDFIMFGSGFGDSAGDANMTTTRVSKVQWSPDGQHGQLVSSHIVMPGSSIKGALRHRVAYRYNQLTHSYVDGDPDHRPQSTDANDAVRQLFGYEEQSTRTQQAGRVLFSDVILPAVPQKLFNHVSIDRFTGGAIDGFLFTEQVDYAQGVPFVVDIYVEQQAFSADPTGQDLIRQALHQALTDICRGMLPLGGSVNRGHGIFTGKLTCNNTVIYDNANH